MPNYVTPTIGGPETATITFKAGFTRLSIVSLSGVTTATIAENSSAMQMPAGLAVNFEAPNNGAHAEVVISTTGTYLFQEYR